MSARLIVVSGTGTGVGKTYVACALTSALGMSGRACALKPFESGAPGPLGPDQSALAACSTDDASALGFASHCFPLPVAPPVAARAAGARVDALEFLRAVDRVRAQYAGNLVVELAGGLFSPFDGNRSNADVVRALGSDTHVLVAPNRLGVLHDVRAALLAARAEGLTVDALIVTHPSAASGDVSRDTNARELADIFGESPFVLPSGPPREAAARIHAALASGALPGHPFPRPAPRASRTRGNG